MSDNQSQNQPNSLEQTAHQTEKLIGAIHAAEKISEGVEEGDIGKIGEGMAVAGVTAATSGTIIGGAVTSVAGAAAGAAVATAALPVGLAVAGVGAVLWLIQKAKE